jgi:serine/threonine protein kinase
MGTVWRAEDELLGREVAVKRLHPPQAHLHEDELATMFERTRREARAAARISHPNVIVVHDVVEDEGLPTIVMEYVPSTTLGELIKKHGPVAPAEAARIGRGMIAALRAAHAAGVLHRDVKPGNVLLGAAGRVVLTDFGIAQASGTSTLTRTGELIGSIDFLAPERLTGRAPGPEADLWALGATLYQAVEGKSPFRRDTAIETAYAIATDEVPEARNAGPLAPVIAGLMARDPEERLSAEEAERLLRGPAAEPETARVDRSELAAAGAVPPADPASREFTAPLRRSGSGPVPEPERRRTAVWLTAAAVVLVVAGGGTYLVTRTHTTGGGPAAQDNIRPTRHPHATPSPTTPSPTASSYTAAPVPEGYALSDETDRGYSVPVPDGWTRQVSANGHDIDFIDPTKKVDLKVSNLDFAGASPLQHWKELEPETAGKVGATYQRQRMNSTLWRGQPAAVWEFTFQGKARTWHAIDLGFGQEGGTEYAIYLSAPDAQWATYKPVFDNAVAGFRLAG